SAPAPGRPVCRSDRYRTAHRDRTSRWDATTTPPRAPSAAPVAPPTSVSTPAAIACRDIPSPPRVYLRVRRARELLPRWSPDRWLRRWTPEGATPCDPLVTHLGRRNVRRRPPSSGEGSASTWAGPSASFARLPGPHWTARPRRADPLPRCRHALRSSLEPRLHRDHTSGSSRGEHATIPADHGGGDQPVPAHRSLPSLTWAPQSSRRRQGE